MKWVLIVTGITFVGMSIMEGIGPAIITSLVLFFMLMVIYAQIRKNRIIACPNCGFRMTLRRFETNGGCIRCGTDLYHDTGRYPRNWA